MVKSLWFGIPIGVASHVLAASGVALLLNRLVKRHAYSFRTGICYTEQSYSGSSSLKKTGLMGASYRFRTCGSSACGEAQNKLGGCDWRENGALMQSDFAPTFRALDRVRINQSWLIRYAEVSLTGTTGNKVLMVGGVIVDVIRKAMRPNGQQNGQAPLL